MKPFPVKNPDNFTNMAVSTRNLGNVPVARDVGGSKGDGTVFKIKADKTPFIVRCLQNRMDVLNAKIKELEEEKQRIAEKEKREITELANAIRENEQMLKRTHSDSAEESTDVKRSK